MPVRREPQPPVRWPAGAIFTVGHSDVSVETFVALLRAYEIERLADIRTDPRSRHNPQFNADSLASALAANQIDYAMLPALGGSATRGRIHRTPAGVAKAFAASGALHRRRAIWASAVLQKRGRTGRDRANPLAKR